MAKLTIEISDDIVDDLNAQADGDATSPEVWIQRKIEHILISLVKTLTFDPIKIAKTADIAIYRAKIAEAKAFIDNRDKPIDQGAEEDPAVLVKQ